MELQMFLEFPGVLITIGVVLLLISIIIIIIAYRSSNKDVDASKLSTNQTSYHGTVNHTGYYDNGKPKIILESNNDDLDKTKVFKKPQNQNIPQDRPTGIKDQIERITNQENKQPISKAIPKETPKPIPPVEEELPTIDVFEEEFNTPSKEDFEKPKIKEAKPGDIINPRKEASKDNIKTVIKKPVYVEEDEDIELL